MRLVFIKLNKPKQFEYKPLYYDPKKEEMADLLKRGEAQSDSSEPALRERIKMKWHSDDHAAKQKSVRGSMLVYLLAVVMLLYFIFF